MHLFVIGFLLIARVIVPLPQSDAGRADAVVASAFEEVHDGWSVDEVLLQDELSEAFIAACAHAADVEVSPALTAAWHWQLINLRKAGKLATETTRSKRVDTAPVMPVAEMVTRSIVDKHQCSIDAVFCDPALRVAFDRLAQATMPGVDGYTVRKAALQLRKARRLRPELITRIADWGRSIKTYSAATLRDQPALLNEHPGVYIFRDATGYLYIGQTDNLRSRLAKHLDESHNAGLATYLDGDAATGVTIEVHDFDPESQANKVMVRRAYESELIASRKPRFNIQP